MVKYSTRVRVVTKLKSVYLSVTCYCKTFCTGSTHVPVRVRTHTCEGKDEAIGSRGAIFQSVAGTGSRSYIPKIICWHKWQKIFKIS